MRDQEDLQSDWVLTPHQGVGRLTFGLSASDVALRAAPYGEPGPLLSGAESASALDDLIAELGPAISDDLLESLQEAATDLQDTATQNLTHDGVPVLLEYRAAGLHGVTVEARHIRAEFEDERVFALKPIDVLMLFERANGAPGRYRSTEAAFDNIAVSLFCFSSTENGEPRPMMVDDPEWAERSITLRQEPYKPASEQDEFMRVSLI